MIDAHQERWHRIRSFEFDPPGAVIHFIDKLIAETGWTRGQAEQAVEEYRRFLLLACVAGHPVSPSPTVDEVWHTHLLYTRSYWDDLCPNVLSFDFHHEPATGTPNDRSKLDDWYARTLASYRTVFQEDASPDVWPAHPVARPMDRVDPKQFVVVPRRAWRVGLVVVTLMFLLLFVALFLVLFSKEV
jgi:hypothetical protein